MATILTAPDRLTAAQRRTITTVYLAGPFEPSGRSWRDQVIRAVDDLDVTVIDPRNDRWSGLDVGSAGRRGAFEWQCTSAYDADVVIVWVPKGASAPTALMILGYLAAKRGGPKKGNSVVVGGGGWDELVTLFAQNSRLFPMGDDLKEVIRVARIQLEAAAAAKAGG